MKALCGVCSLYWVKRQSKQGNEISGVEDLIGLLILIVGQRLSRLAVRRCLEISGGVSGKGVVKWGRELVVVFGVRGTRAVSDDEYDAVTSMMRVTMRLRLGV